MNETANNQTVYWLLMQVMFQSKHAIYSIAENYGLTFMQSGALTILSQDSPQPMRKLSDCFMCDASTITGLVDRLESRGLVIRQNHPSDRRIKLLALTSQGAKLKAEIMAKTLAIESEKLDRLLSDDEQQQLRVVLQRILAS